MNSDNENNGLTRPRSNGQTGTDGWGAKDSLKRNFRMDKKSDDEVTPLLGSGSGSGSGRSSEYGRAGESEWEGYADYEGLSTWKKPTVGWGLTSSDASRLTVTGVLVIATILPLRSRGWRYPGPEVEYDPLPGMQAILH